MDDLLRRIKDAVVEVRDGLYEHGLSGPQASSYVDRQREHAEPAVEACLEAIDRTIAEYQPRTDVTKEQAANARARRIVDRKIGDNRHIIDLLCDEIERLRKGYVPTPEQIEKLRAAIPPKQPEWHGGLLLDQWRDPRLGNRQ
jgi:hypothetical protein